MADGGDGGRSVRIALLPDGVTVLRFAGVPDAATAAGAVRLLEDLALRLETARAAVTGLGALIDLAVAAASAGLALAATLSADGAWRPAAVALCYAAAVPLRAPVLRWLMRRVLAVAARAEAR